MKDFGDVIDTLSNLPGLKWIVWILKKVGFLKDYEALYKTDKRVKALGNAFQKIDFSFSDVTKEIEIAIPCAILFRQKGIPTPETLRRLGFLPLGKSMGLYVLPPLEISKKGIKKDKDLHNWLIKELNLEGLPLTCIRLAHLIDLRHSFVYRHSTIKAETIYDKLKPNIVEYLGADKSFHLIKEYYRKNQKTITEKEIIDKAPLSHIFADYLDYAAFERLKINEDAMLKYLESINAIRDHSYLSLASVNNAQLKDCLTVYIGHIENLDEITDEALKQAKFMATKL